MNACCSTICRAGVPPARCPAPGLASWFGKQFGLGVRSAVLAAGLLAVAGCSADQAQVAMRSVTPSFMLSPHDRAERSLKDPAALNLAYGHFQEQVGQTAEARRSYESALHDDPKSVDAVLGLARLDQLADKPKDAEAGFQKALKLKPDDPHVLAACGQFYAAQQRWPEAFQSLNAAIAAAPKEVIYKHALAVAKTRAGDIDGGLAIFAQLVGPEKAHYNVAYLLRQDGKSEAAAHECRVSLSLNPNFEPAKAMLQQLHSGQVAGTARDATRRPVRPAGTTIPASAASQTSFSAGPTDKGFATPVAGTRTQPSTPTNEASWWQSPSPTGAGSTPATGGHATFAPVRPENPSTGGVQLQPPVSAADQDPWAASVSTRSSFGAH